ncbi:MAG TPA: type II secretion system F family protein [Vicinamibacterales bacterium]|nr:type II secretion system F family protein [Vicinamibacterales bacterium]
MEFRCRLVTAGGEIVEGTYAADSESRLRHELEERGLHVLSIRPRGGIAGTWLRLPRRRRISTREFLEFNQELATLLKAGMPLVQSLDLLRGGIRDPLFRSVVDTVHSRVRAGASLSEAFGEHGALVSGVYTASLLAGERSGSLDTVLRRYVSYARLLASVRRRTISALIYPAVLVALSLVVVGIIVFKLVPEFALFYASFDAELPLLTRAILGVATTLNEHILLVGLAVVGAAAALMLWIREPGQAQRFDRALLALPWLGDVVRKFGTAQLARTLSTLLGGGLPLVNALDVAGRSISNRHLAAELDAIGRSVREGQALAEAMRARGAFPDVAVKMTEVGESTGSLQEMLASVAEFYDEEVATTLERFVTLVEPALLIVMGIVIAGLLLALYLPLFELSSVVR